MSGFMAVASWNRDGGEKRKTGISLKILFTSMRVSKQLRSGRYQTVCGSNWFLTGWVIAERINDKRSNIDELLRMV